jgi:hypothetical protein
MEFLLEIQDKRTTDGKKFWLIMFFSLLELQLVEEPLHAFFRYIQAMEIEYVSIDANTNVASTLNFMKKTNGKTMLDKRNSVSVDQEVKNFFFLIHKRLLSCVPSAFFACISLIFIFFSGALEANTVATVQLSDTYHYYDGNAKQVRVTTVPAGLSVSVTYAERTAPSIYLVPINVGVYVAVATVTEPGYTGTASATFSIAKTGQTLKISPVAPKKLGDAPFQVSASPNSGLLVSRWESSDTSVATVSSSGMVTMIGAGQTSLVAVQDGNGNYNPKREAVPLDVALSDAPLPAARRDLVFHGAAHEQILAELPSGAASFVSYRNVSQPVTSTTPEVIFQNGPDVLDLSYVSTGFSATSTSALGKYVQFAGSPRQLHSCDVTLVNWARYETTSASWLAANPHLVVPPKSGISIPGDSGGYYHPITLSFYEYEVIGTTESFRLLMSKTINGFIPWRPMRLANGSTYPHNGYAFRVPFEFTEGFILPDFLVIGVSFNTENSGAKPIGTSGPYNLLNVPFIPTVYTPKIGTTLYDPFTFVNTNWIWSGSATTYGPMLRVRATPAVASFTPPVAVGTYEVKTFSTAFPEQSSATSLWVIKAPVQVYLSNMSHIFDGSPKGVSVSTVPADIPTITTYSGSSSAPTAAGRYDVVVEANHPTYAGTARGFLTINDTYHTWKDAAFAGSGISEHEKVDNADPDGDGLNNLLAYAANVQPTNGNAPSVAKMEQQIDTLTFTYRSNALASDVVYAVETSDDLADPQSWKIVVPLEVSVLSDDGKTRVNQVKVARLKEEKQMFMRLKVQRNEASTEP